MATVGTSTQSDPLNYPNTAAIGRDLSTSTAISGRSYVAIKTSSTQLTVYRSTDSSATSWASFSSFTHSGILEWSRVFVDKNDWLHIAYRVGDGSADTLWYRRLNLLSAAWSSALQISATDANGGVNGSRWQGLDMAVVRNSDNSYVIAIFGAFTDGTTRYGLWGHGVAISPSAVITNNDGLISNNRIWLQSGTAPGRAGVTVELEHNGDGVTSTTPHIWVTFGRTQLRMVKLAWQGASLGWSGPTSWQTIRTSISVHDYIPARWDGAQWLMGIISPDDTAKVRVYQRNQANTTTTTFDTPTHPTGNVRHLGLSYDNITKDIRVFAVGTSTGVLYYCDYTRATGLWTPWATVVATAIGPNVRHWSIRAGGTSANAKHDVITTVSGSPNTVNHTGMAASSVPNIATWAAPVGDNFNGGARNVGAGLLLDWDFSDPDPGETQGSYALSRQIGAGAIQYWRASDSTWQVSEVQNASATTQVVLPIAWGLSADAAHAYKVKVWDSAAVAAVAYSAPWVVIPSVPVDPAITAPTVAQVLNLDQVTVSWTAAEQTAFRVQLNTNPATDLWHDSGYISATDTSYTVPVALANGTQWTVSLTTRNTEGLASNTVTRNFSTQYGAPPAALPVFAPSTANGYILVTSTALAPVGVQPATVILDLYRRPVTAASTTLNANPTFAGNTTGYIVGGGGGTLSYSTTQSAPSSSPGAGRLVPNGVASSPQIESSTVAIDPLKTYEASGWIRPDTGNKAIYVAVNWYTSGSVYISSTLTTLTLPVATAWQFLTVTANASSVANAARASVGVGESGTPAAGDAFYGDELRLRESPSAAAVPVAKSVSAPGAVEDSGATSGVDYEYRWVSVGTNGSRVEGPWVS